MCVCVCVSSSPAEVQALHAVRPALQLAILHLQRARRTDPRPESPCTPLPLLMLPRGLPVAEAERRISFSSSSRDKSRSGSFVVSHGKWHLERWCALSWKLSRATAFGATAPREIPSKQFVTLSGKSCNAAPCVANTKPHSKCGFIVNTHTHTARPGALHRKPLIPMGYTRKAGFHVFVRWLP